MRKYKFNQNFIAKGSPMLLPDGQTATTDYTFVKGQIFDGEKTSNNFGRRI